MKVLILLTCALAGVSCGWIPITSGYHNQHHVPVIKNGVPVETPEVQHAKAAHFAAISKEVSNPHYTHNDHHEHGYEIHHKDNYDQTNNYHQYSHLSNIKHDNHEVQPVSYKKVPLAYETSHVLPEIDHDGKPLDTPEVEAAKAHHFQAFNKALALTAPHSDEPEPYYQEHRYRRSILNTHIPVIGHDGVPVEPLEVQEARQKHLEAHAAAHHSSSSGFAIHQDHPQIYANYHSHEIPHIGHDGKPLDTAEVAHAKAAHFAAHNEALSRNLVKHVEHVDYWNSPKDYHY